MRCCNFSCEEQTMMLRLIAHADRIEAAAMIVTVVALLVAALL